MTIFNDLANSRAAADEIDAIAAAYPLLSISREPVGTGPFQLVNFRPGQNLEYTRNEQYHFGTPAIEEMFLPIITDEVAAASAIQGGTVDWKYSLTADAFAQLENDPNVKFAEYPDFGYFGLQFNLRDGKLFADKNLRQAVAYCAQKEDIVNVATEGQGVPIYADIPPASWAYNPEVEQYGFDVEQGRALIEEAGWTEGADGVYEKDGQRLATEVLVRSGKPDRIAFMQLLSDELNSNCGFDMSIREVEFGTVLVPMLSWPHMQQGKTGNELEKQFDAYFGGWGTGFDPDPYALWHSSQCTTADQADTYNYICFQNDRADELIQEGLAELDQDARAEIYQEFEAILAEDLPYLFAWSDVAREALRTSISTTEGDLQLNSPQWHWELHNLTNTAAE
ncbi:MAG: hypothetical protein H0V12_05320 [Chloroflexi bacterium]|nr:hypothetical protein [Chloroflexota bacterium]